MRQFLQRKWANELDYRLIKELWAFTDNRIAVRFAYEWHDASGLWFRSYGNTVYMCLFADRLIIQPKRIRIDWQPQNK